VIDTSLSTGKGSCAFTYEWHARMSRKDSNQTKTLSSTAEDSTDRLGTGDKLTLYRDQFSDYDYINGYVTITTCWGTSGVGDFSITLKEEITIPEIKLNRSNRTIKRS